MAKKPSRGLINARLETIQEKPSFKKALLARRCLVLADSFFEWSHAAYQKNPYRILLASRTPFAFAGIYEMYHQPNGPRIPTFSIITTPPNAVIAPLHNRMPAILRPEHESLWLDQSAAIPAVLEVLRPLPASELMIYPVTPRVNSYTFESPEAIKPI